MPCLVASFAVGFLGCLQVETITDTAKKMLIEDLIKIRNMLSELSYQFDDLALSIETDLQMLEEEGDI